MLNPEYGDITDIESGTDLDLQYGKAPGQSFPQTKLTPKRSTSPVCVEATPEACKEILDSIPDIDGLFEKKSSQEVAGYLAEYMSTDTSAEDASSEAAKFAPPKGAEAVDKSFSDLLGSA